MKALISLISFLLVLFLTQLSHAQNVDCTKQEAQQSMLEMKFCAGAELERADKKLNEVWAKVKASMQELDKQNGNFFPTNDYASKNLLDAQRAWIKYRDGHCEVAGAPTMGGTLQPLIITLCHTELTRNRTQELQKLLEEGY